MSSFFDTAYRAGYAPWDRDDAPPAVRVRALVERAQIAASGRGLDLGCGTGRNAVYLAAHGWTMTAVDFSGAALRRARAQAADAHVAVDFVEGDVARLEQSGIDGPFDLLLDAGCFHCLSEEDRRGYADSVRAVAAADARFFLFSTTGGSGPLMPRGAARDEIDRILGRDWVMAASEDFPMPGPKNTHGAWYELRRREP